MSKQEEDKFYIMASTNAHIGEALETISQPHHEAEARTPLIRLVKTTIFRFASIVITAVSILSRWIKKRTNPRP